VEISVRKTLKSRKYEQPSQLIVQLKNNRENHFALDRYYNYTLSSGTFNHVAGYFLTDVTAIQGKVVSLDEKYRRQLRRGERLKSLLEEQAARGDIFVGSGRRISEIKNTARTIATSDATVLIDGPTGAGKEVLANYIHSHSSRKDGPFIKVDCSTIPRSLMESQLFGHEKGSFTGAIARSTGLFEQAHGGTLFLDEVSNLPMETQVKLLQFFNDFNITRVGGAKSIKLNVRSIIASNVSLEKLVKSGVFREDLYYRINVVYLKLPSLKERIEDIPELCRHFLEYFNAINNKEITGFSPQAYKKLEAYDWPGNIRELKNVIERSVIFCDSDTITDLHIIFSKREEEDIPIVPDPGKKRFHLSRTSRDYMIGMLKRHGGNVSELAKVFNVTRAPLYQFFKKHKINIEEFRKGYGE
jgi:two-component system response regulator HydG